MRALLVSFILLTASGPNLLAQTPDSVRKKNSYPENSRAKTKSLIKIVAAPVVLISLGLYTKEDGHVLNRFSVRDWRDDRFPGFSNHADNAMQFIPIGVVYGLDLVNVKSKNDLVNRSLILLKSEILMNGLVHTLKRTTNIARPDGSNHHAFPSGHTAQAFVAATFLHKELGHKSVWFSIGGYTMATAVGALRVLNNRHWISDVLAGAGFGILSTNIAYATHRYKWGKRPDVVVLPTYSNGPGIFVSWRVGEND